MSDLPELALPESEGDEIEAAYLKALMASEELDAQETDAELSTEPQELEASPSAPAVAGVVAESPTPELAAAPAPEPVAKTGPIPIPSIVLDDDSESPLSPAQVIEAALFVGGQPLSSKRICGMLRGSFTPELVEQSIEELNALYAAQGRPYEIRPGDGGFRLDLRPEFEKYRNRVYGTGPREVRLTQEVLEVLAVVAYKQPIAAADVEVARKGSGNALRQLLRRELIGLTRGDGGPKDIRYHTTPRFLQLFGLGSLADLPQMEDVSHK